MGHPLLWRQSLVLYGVKTGPSMPYGGPKLGLIRVLRLCSGRAQDDSEPAPGGSGLLTHCSGYAHVCSDLKTEMDFGEVEFSLWLWWYPRYMQN